MTFDFDLNKLNGKNGKCIYDRSCIKYIRFDNSEETINALIANINYIVATTDHEIMGFGLRDDPCRFQSTFCINYGKGERREAENGDYIVFHPSGEVLIYDFKTFNKLYVHNEFTAASFFTGKDGSYMPSSYLNYLNTFSTDLVTASALTFSNRTYKAPTYKEKYKSYQIERVIISYPATIVFFKDKTKIVVKCAEDEYFDLEKALALAIARKALGNKGSYLNFIKDGMKKAEYIDIKED